MSKLGKRQLHELYYYMKLTQQLEEGIARLHSEGKIPGPVCLAAGREAMSVGVAYPLNPGDFLASSASSVGSLLVRRVQPLEILAHFMGKDSGVTRGRDGSTRFGGLEKGFVSPGGHQAAHLSVMAGVAYAAKFMEKKAVAVAIMGERAMATGDFHEGFNFAAVHQLPLIVVVENGPYPSSHSTFIKNPYVYEIARGYGVPSLPVDGTDVLQVIQAVESAIDRARSGKGPTLLEARTARSKHYPTPDGAIPMPFEGEQAIFRLESGKVQFVENDPVAQFETFLVDHGLIEPVERGLILERVQLLVDNRIELAEQEPFPDSEGLNEGVYQMENESSSGKMK
jgi:pyruvate dehydrogenase E1 component alpha subunit